MENTIFHPVNDFIQSITFSRLEKYQYQNTIPVMCDKYIVVMRSVIDSATGCAEEAKGYINTLEIIKEEYDIATQIMIDNILIRTQ